MPTRCTCAATSSSRCWARPRPGRATILIRIAAEALLPPREQEIAMRYAWVLPAGGGLVAALAAAAAIAGSGHFRVVNDNDRYAIDKMWVAEVNDEDWTAMTMTYPVKA